MMKFFKIPYILIIMVFLISIVSAQYFNYYNFTPSNLLENEWFVFAGVFLVFFAIVYVSLSNVFSSGKMKENKGAVVAISAIIALFCAAAFVQRGWVYSTFGGVWLFLIALIVIVILSIPFYKALKMNVGKGPAIFLILIFIWAILKFFVNPEIFYELEYSFEIMKFYEFVTSYYFLIIVVVVTIIFSAIKKEK